jgi:hypothetical protein
VQATVAREQRAFLTVMVRGQRHHHQSQNADGGRQSHIEQMRLLVRRDVRGEAIASVCSRLTASVGLGGARAVRDAVGLVASARAWLGWIQWETTEGAMKGQNR